MICGIYKIINSVNNKYYVGSSIDIHRRWRQHKYLLEHKKHHNSNLQNDWILHEERCFKFEVVAEIKDDEYLMDYEQWYLDLAKKEHDCSYNLCFKAFQFDFTTETRNKLRVSQLKRFQNCSGPMLGKKHSSEAKSKISKANKGRKFSQEQIAESYKGKKNRNYNSTVYIFINSKSLERFDGTRFEFLTKYSLSSSHLTNLIKGKAKSCKGWKIQNES